MKISAFHLMPYRELPADFEQRYESVWVTPPWWELADARRVGQYYNWTLDELTYAAKCGFDGVCTNEHHQNAYGFMPSPNLMGSVLARATNGMDVAIVQMGATLPTSNPPLRVAEEYAMLDCISGGRLVAGLPLGSPMDVNLCYGITPMEHRERYREAVALTLKAWQAREIFSWNGRYFQLATVNLWPRPIQQPHPPVWVPGSGSISTFDFAVEHDVCYCFLSYSGARSAKTMMDGYWRVVAEKGRDANPYRAGFLQLVVVAENDYEKEKLQLGDKTAASAHSREKEKMRLADVMANRDHKRKLEALRHSDRSKAQNAKLTAKKTASGVKRPPPKKKVPPKKGSK